MYNISDFVYNKTTKTFISEISEMKNLKENFSIKSDFTNVVKKFIFSYVKKDEEGDIQFWEFLSECGKFKAVIFND